MKEKAIITEIQDLRNRGWQEWAIRAATNRLEKKLGVKLTEPQIVAANLTNPKESAEKLADDLTSAFETEGDKTKVVAAAEKIIEDLKKEGIADNSKMNEVMNGVTQRALDGSLTRKGTQSDKYKTDTTTKGKFNQFIIDFRNKYGLWRLNSKGEKVSTMLTSGFVRNSRGEIIHSPLTSEFKDIPAVVFISNKHAVLFTGKKVADKYEVIDPLPGKTRQITENQIEFVDMFGDIAGPTKHRILVNSDPTKLQKIKNELTKIETSYKIDIDPNELPRQNENDCLLHCLLTAKLSKEKTS